MERQHGQRFSDLTAERVVLVFKARSGAGAEEKMAATAARKAQVRLRERSIRGGGRGGGDNSMQPCAC